MNQDQPIMDCAVFMLIKDNQVLAERRKLTKETDPGLLAIPGGHCEENESPEEALHRELYEELRVTLQNSRYVCSLLHLSKELQRLHYFAIESWQGNIENHEAESLHWVAFAQLQVLDLYVDQLAVREYQRIYQ